MMGLFRRAHDDDVDIDAEFDRIRDEMRPSLFVPERPPAMLSSEFGDLSGAVGAAVLAGG